MSEEQNKPLEDSQVILHTSPFDAIRRIDDEGREYWSARDLSKILGYTEYGKFKNAIKRAEIACANSGQIVEDHFAHVSEMVAIGSGAKRRVEDVFLSRYACYLLVESSDPNKPIVALGHSYFAEQTRIAELTATNEFNNLPEHQKRLYLRGEINVHNKQLAETARAAGVVEPKDFAIFKDHGYKGLYGGETTVDIHARKKLAPKQHILDYMGSEELANNIFLAAQTSAKLKRDKISDKETANKTHHQIGRKVRKAIKDIGGTMPEDLPTPQKSIQQLQKEENKRLKQGPQLSMFDEDAD